MESWLIEGGSELKSQFDDRNYVKTATTLAELINRDVKAHVVKFDTLTSKLIEPTQLDQFFITFDAIRQLQLLITADQALLVNPSLTAEMAMNVSANRIENIRRIQTDFQLICTNLQDDLLDRIERLYDAVTTFAAGADPATLKKLGEQYDAANLAAKLLPYDEARKFMVEWGQAHLKPEPWQALGPIGQPGTFDLRGILDYDYMVEHGYDKLTEESGISVELIRKTETIKIGEGSAPVESQTFCISSHAELAINKHIAREMNVAFQENNKPVPNPTALEDLYVRQSNTDRYNKQQHKNSQLDRMNRGLSALDTMIIKRPLDLWRYKEVLNAQTNAQRRKKSVKEVNRMVLEHKVFSGYDTQESEVYERVHLSS